MRELKQQICAHIIEEKTGKMLSRPTLYHCPRIGEVIRLAADNYVKVTQVIWVLDEYEHEQTRVNIGVSPVKD